MIEAKLTRMCSSVHSLKRFGRWYIDDYTNHKRYRGWRTSAYHKKWAKLKQNHD